MLKIERIMEALEPDAQRRVAFHVHRVYGGPLTGAERQALYRTRRNDSVTSGDKSVTGGSNDGVTNGASHSTIISSSSSASVREENRLLRQQATEVLAFLNHKTNRSYRFIDANLDLIAARLKSGATVQDCRAVIARQTREWLNDPAMSKYLRPETLFRASKFEGYLGLAAPSDV